MARSARHFPAGLVYHVHNRAVAGRSLFKKYRDYFEFFKLIDRAWRRHPFRIVSYCLLPAEWRFVLWPRDDGEVTAFLRWLTHAHVMGCRADRPVPGPLKLYRGRFRSFPVEAGEPLFAVLRHVAWAPVQAGLVDRADAWQYGSFPGQPGDDEPDEPDERMSDGPVPLPPNWLAYVNQPQPPAEFEAIRESEERGRPFGSADWQRETAKRLELEFTLRPRGRPRQAAR